MTVGKGQPWGVPATPPADLRTADGDAELAALVSHDPGGSYAVRAGDLHRSIGAPAARRELHLLPIDAMRVSIDGTHVLAVSHVIARNRWWSGPIVAVSNCGYIGALNVAPRAHPNDGRFDIVEVSPSMSPRQRWQARGRLRHGTHVPHPDVSTRTAALAEWDFDGPLMVHVDGVRQGRCTRLGVTILPDHFAIYA